MVKVGVTAAMRLWRLSTQTNGNQFCPPRDTIVGKMPPSRKIGLIFFYIIVLLVEILPGLLRSKKRWGHVRRALPLGLGVLESSLLETQRNTWGVEETLSASKVTSQSWGRLFYPVQKHHFPSVQFHHFTRRKDTAALVSSHRKGRSNILKLCTTCWMCHVPWKMRHSGLLRKPVPPKFFSKNVSHQLGSSWYESKAKGLQMPSDACAIQRCATVLKTSAAKIWKKKTFKNALVCVWVRVGTLERMSAENQATKKLQDK